MTTGPAEGAVQVDGPPNTKERLMTKKATTMTTPKGKSKTQKATGVPLTHSSRAQKDVPADPDENMKWMTAGRLLLGVITVLGALVARGWMTARRAGRPPGSGSGPERDSADVLQSV